MRNLENILKKRAINYRRLAQYGFIKNDDLYIYKTNIMNNKFEVNIGISADKSYSKLIDNETNEEYTLVDIQSATGEFVGKARYEYENIINDVVKKCTTKDVFKSTQAKEIINYISLKYGDSLEFLWEKSDDNAVWRNKKNNKWYGVLLTIKKEKLGIKSDEMIEIIDLRYQKDSIDTIIDNDAIYPGYHMNKKSWITIRLDNKIETKEIIELVDNSHNLSEESRSKVGESNLAQKVYDYLTTIPKGKVVTYKQIAEYLGNKGLARAVGNILHKNPDGDKYPCYKVVNSKGELASEFVFGGKNVQKQRLEDDGIEVCNNRVDLDIYKW